MFRRLDCLERSRRISRAERASLASNAFPPKELFTDWRLIKHKDRERYTGTRQANRFPAACKGGRGSGRLILAEEPSIQRWITSADSHTSADSLSLSLFLLHPGMFARQKERYIHRTEWRVKAHDAWVKRRLWLSMCDVGDEAIKSPFSSPPVSLSGPAFQGTVFSLLT